MRRHDFSCSLVHSLKFLSHRIRIYKVIHLSIIQDQSHFPLILLYYCHQRNQSSRLAQLFLRVQHKPRAAIHFPICSWCALEPDIQPFNLSVAPVCRIRVTCLLPCCGRNACVGWKLHWSQARLSQWRLCGGALLAAKIISPEPLIWTPPRFVIMSTPSRRSSPNKAGCIINTCTLDFQLHCTDTQAYLSCSPGIYPFN